MAFEDIDTRSLESIARDLENLDFGIGRIVHVLEGDEPKECTPIECITHALESIAKSMDPNFKPLYLVRSDITDSMREMREQYLRASIAKGSE